MLEAVQRKLGKTTATKRADWKLNFSTGGTMVALNYETSLPKAKGRNNSPIACPARRPFSQGTTSTRRTFSYASPESSG
jgi:hypothetical protein